jgi:hypothetical protein
MRNLTRAELDGIAERAELCFRYGDRSALRADDVADLITEVRELHDQREHHLALIRQHHDRQPTTYREAWLDAAWLEMDPP